MKPARPLSCWLCERSLGDVVQWHHPVPKAKGGRDTVPVHPICHRAIHAHFTNAVLARIGGARDTIAANPEMARFLTWIAKKPPNFHAPTKRGNKAVR